MISDDNYLEIGRQIAGYYAEFQSVIALHSDLEYRHLHIIFNSVSFNNGKKFSQGPPKLKSFKSFCNHVLDKYGLDLIRCSPETMLITKDNSFAEGYDFLEINNDKPQKREHILVEDLDDNFDNKPPELMVCTDHERLEFVRRLRNMNWRESSCCESRDKNVITTKSSAPTVPQTNTAPRRNDLLSIGNYNEIKVEVDSTDDITCVVNKITNSQPISSEQLIEAAQIGAQTKLALEKNGSFANVHIGNFNNVTISLKKHGEPDDIIDADFTFNDNSD